MKYLRRLSRKLAICLALVLTVGGMLGNGMTVSAAEEAEAPKKALELIDVERDAAGNVTWKLADESLREYLSEVVFYDLNMVQREPINASLAQAISNNEDIVASSELTSIKFLIYKAPQIVWDDIMIGLFTISYEQEEKSTLCIDLYYNGTLIDSTQVYADDNIGHVEKNYAHFQNLNESGEYVLKAVVKDADGSESAWGSSDVLEYTRPDKALEIIDVMRESDGRISWKFSDEENMRKYYYYIDYLDSNGNSVTSSSAVAARAISMKPNIYAHSPIVPIEGAGPEQSVDAPIITWDGETYGKFWVAYNQLKDTNLCLEFYYNDTCLETLEYNHNQYRPSQGYMRLDFSRYHYINESGKYYVKASVRNTDGSVSKWITSDILEYERPDTELELIDVKRDADGNVTWKLADESLREYMYPNIQYSDKSGKYANQKVAAFAQALSKNVDVVANSKLVSIQGDAVGDVVGTEEPTTTWEPSTPEEIQSFSYRSSIPVSFSVAGANDGSISMCGEAQGNLFFDVVESVLGEYTIASTYNIGIDGQKFYETEKEIQMCIKVPASLANEGRTFKMITVDESGVPYIFEDLDNDPDTITFTVDKGYAYALCYVDAN